MTQGLDHFGPQGHGRQVSDKTFLCSSQCKPMADNDAIGAGPEWIPGARLAGFIKIYSFSLMIH